MAAFWCGVSFTRTSCAACNGLPCRNILQAVDGNLATDWDPSASNAAFVIDFEYPGLVAAKGFFVATLSATFDRAQWTVQAGNTSGQYTFSLPTFVTTIGAIPKQLDFSSSTVYARCPQKSRRSRSCGGAPFARPYTAARYPQADESADFAAYKALQGTWMKCMATLA